MVKVPDLFPNMAPSMKGFTLWEPWASLMAAGYKKNETRSWQTKYRGPLVIHAAKTDREAGAAPRIFKAAALSDEKLSTFLDGVGDSWPFGKIVAVVNLIDCIPTEQAIERGVTKTELACGDYGPGRFAWITEDLVKVDPPIPWKGSQGFWRIPEDLARRLNSNER